MGTTMPTLPLLFKVMEELPRIYEYVKKRFYIFLCEQRILICIRDK